MVTESGKAREVGLRLSTSSLFPLVTSFNRLAFVIFYQVAIPETDYNTILLVI